MQLIKEYKANYKITQPHHLYKYLKEFAEETKEFFIVVGLDTKNGVLYKEVISIGTLNSSIIHSREVFKTAIIKSCNCIIVGHNHPSGDLEPSPEDLEIKGKLEQAGEILGIKVLDNVIFSKGGFKSIGVV